MKYGNLTREQLCCDSNTQRMNHEHAEIYRAKYHEAKRECDDKAAEFYCREFNHYNKLLGNILSLEQAA